MQYFVQNNHKNHYSEVASHYKYSYRSLPNQFLKHRHATDNAIIIQEIVRQFKKMKGKKDNFIMKIDLEKDLDKIQWSFVKHTLAYFNFPNKAIILIMS